MEPAPHWPHAASDLAPDPGVRFGTLPNGMLYALQRNTTPSHQVSIRLRVAAGSMEEAEDQRGLAHLLEHMAFKGSTHVAEGEMVKALERHGLAFGPDTNAATAWTETSYMLDLPGGDADTLSLGLSLMRETASELTLSPKALESERGVVLAEERLRDTPAFEVAKSDFATLLKGQPAADRFPIGKVAVIKTAPASRLRAFYAANYRPEHAALIVVGDIDPVALEAKVKALFGDWRGKGAPSPAPDFGRIAQRGQEAHLTVRPGARLTATLAFVTPYDARPDTKAKRRSDQIENLGFAVLNRRLERLAQGADAPFVGASAERSDLLHSATLAQVEATPKPGRWREAVAAIIAATRQAAAFGVTEAELAREITTERASLQNALAGAATRKTPSLAGTLAASLDGDFVVTDPATDLALFEAEVADLNAGTVSAALRTALAGQGPLLLLTSPDPVPGGEAAAADALKAGVSAPVAPLATRVTKPWPYTAFGPAGAVVARKAAPFGTTFVTFANGVRLAIKPTDYSKGQVLVNLRIGRGRLDLPTDRANLAWAMPALTLGGTRALTDDEMREALTGKRYSATAQTADDATVLRGATRPQDLAVQLQVLTAYVAEPGWRPEGLERLKNLWRAQLDQLGSTPQGVLSRDLGLLTHSGDPRWALPTAPQVEAASLADIKGAFDPMLAIAPLEVDIVGDVTVEEAVALTAATLGALPPRAASSKTVASDPRFPAGIASPIIRSHTGRADQSEALQVWPSTGYFADPQGARAISVMTNVLQLRLTDRLRVAEGASYSPAAYDNQSQVFATYGTITASVEIPPERASAFFTEVSAIAANLARTGPTADEFERARKPRIVGLLRAQQTNEYWITWLSGAADDPRRLAAVEATIPGYQALTPADVKAAAARYLKDDAAWRLVVRAGP